MTRHVCSRTSRWLPLVALAISATTTGCSSIEERRLEAQSAADRRLLASARFEAPLRDDTTEGARLRFDPSLLRPASLEDIERLGLRRGEYALRVDRTLMYPCQWLRAEQLAPALEPIVQAQYGSTARVIPNPETNYLFIYIPPPAERRATGGPATAGRAADGRPQAASTDTR